MQDTPLTSASDILSYHGDAGLASGSGAGTLPVMPDYQPMLNTVDKLQEEQVQKRKEARVQAQKDLEDRAKFISQLTNNGGSVFNTKGKDGSNQSYSMLPNDQEDINNSAMSTIQAVNSNPSGYAFDPNIAKMQMDHNRLLTNAQMRATYESQARLAAAQTQDPEEKAGYLKSIDDEINKYKVGDFHHIQPYVPPIKYSEGDRIDLAAVKDPKNLETKQDDGSFETKIPNEGVVGNTLNLSPGDPAYLPNMDMAAKFLKSPLAHSQADLLRMKNAQDQYNFLNQYQPGDPKYRDVVAVDPTTGQVALNITGDPKVDGLKVADMLNIEKYAQPRKVAKKYEEIEKLKQDAIKNQRDQNKDAEDKREFEIAQRDKETAAANKAPSKEELVEDRDKIAAQNAYHEAKEVFKVDIPKDVNAGLKFPSWWKDHGINPDQYNIIPYDNKNAESFIGKEATVDGSKDANGNTTKTPTGQSITPYKTYMIANKQTGDKELVYVDEPDKDKNGEKQSELGGIIARVNEKDAVVNKLKHEAKYDPKIYENQATWAGIYGNNEGKDPDAAPVVTAPAPTATVAPEKAPSIPAGYTEKTSKSGTVYYRTAQGQNMVWSHGEWVEIPGKK